MYNKFLYMILVILSVQVPASTGDPFSVDGDPTPPSDTSITTISATSSAGSDSAPAPRGRSHSPRRSPTTSSMVSAARIDSIALREQEEADAALAASLETAEAEEAARKADQEAMDAALAASLAEAETHRERPSSPARIRAGVGARASTDARPTSPPGRRSSSPARAGAGVGARTLATPSPLCAAVEKIAADARCSVGPGARSTVPSLCDQLHAMTVKCDVNAHNPGFTNKEVTMLWGFMG